MRKPIEFPRLNYDWKLNGPDEPEDTRKDECSRCCTDKPDLVKGLCEECRTHCELCEGELSDEWELKRNVCHDCAGTDSDQLDEGEDE